MNLGDLNKVWEVKALKKPGEDEALKILDKIAKQVQPIMKKHKWRVQLVSEFYPSNPALLGLNIGGGVEVKLRLRRANREWDFIPYEQILDTMLHELCHNEYGPHNADFYKLWDEIRKECEELVGKGISGSGEGFDRQGRRLGGFMKQPAVSDLRKAALAAAEKRSRVGSLMPNGPRRVGGDSGIMSALSPLQAAAMAAERRMKDELWCGSQAFPVLVDDDIGSQPAQQAFPPMGLSGESSNSSSNNIHTDATEKISKENMTKASSSGSYVTDEKSFWECEICTLMNPALAPICEACGVEKPKEKGMKFKIWSCKFCTLENSVKMDKCKACGQWRYSYGAPTSSQINLGT